MRAIKTVMIIEDCTLTLQMTKFILIKLGVENILTASNESEFRQLINGYVIPDLIITDWNIDKNLKGHDVISSIEKLGKPIAVVSSEDKKQLPHDKYYWFKKPLKVDELVNWLQRICL